MRYRRHEHVQLRPAFSCRPLRRRTSWTRRGRRRCRRSLTSAERTVRSVLCWMSSSSRASCSVSLASIPHVHALFPIIQHSWWCIQFCDWYHSDELLPLSDSYKPSWRTLHTLLLYRAVISSVSFSVLYVFPACLSSRPGQCGRADGYVLEGKELEFYLRKIKAKKGK